MKKIGFIGLGKMGLPMAQNLCRAGYSVMVCSSNKDSAKLVVELGGEAVASYKIMAETADVIITIVPADKEILGLYLGEAGLIENMRANTVCIDMTSAQGSTMRLLRDYTKERNIAVNIIDAPVSGGVPAAVSGKLTIMVGCDDVALFEDNKAILEAMGEKIFYTGALGSGSDIKMINQMLNASNTAAACEAVSMAKQLGIDTNILCDVINQSSGGSFVFKNTVPKFILTGEHTPGFRLDLMKKDVGLFVTAAKENEAVMPISELVYQIYKATSNQGKGDRNHSCIAEWVEGNQKKERN